MKLFHSFKVRSNEAELMDDLTVSNASLQGALSDIKIVNSLLGGHRVSMEGLRPWLRKRSDSSLHIVDMGCGDGDFLRYLARYCRGKNIPVRLTGVDRNPESLSMGSRLSAEYPEIAYEVGDVLDFKPLPGEDVLIVCNLFIHHLEDHEILALFKHWLGSGCSSIVVNDLHRSPLAYCLFRLFGFIFMKSALARNDGRVSIKRGFTRNELEQYSRRLPCGEFQIRWKWAFRYLWILKSKEEE